MTLYTEQRDKSELTRIIHDVEVCSQLGAGEMVVVLDGVI